MVNTAQELHEDLQGNILPHSIGKKTLSLTQPSLGLSVSMRSEGQSLSWLLAYSRREVSPSSSQGEPQAWHTDILW